MFRAQKRREGVDVGGFRWAIVILVGVGAIKRQIECVMVDLYSPLADFSQCP